MTSIVRQLALLQLASPALPIGGYSYSGGLEWALESGQVIDAQTAQEWISDLLVVSLASFDGPLVCAALSYAARLSPVCDSTEQFEEQLEEQLTHSFSALQGLNQAALAARETAELRLESEQMGYSLGRWLASVCPHPEVDTWLASELPRLTLPLAWALAAARLGLSEREAVLAYFWSVVENQVMVLLKALPMGQIAGQRLLRALVPVIEQALERAVTRSWDDASSSAPLLAVASCQHETQYTRLFRS